MEVLAVGSAAMLNRPCVDCGQWTGRFCDFCRAVDRIPTEVWTPNQMTPPCSICDNRYDRCHFCRRVQWTRPFAWGVTPMDDDEQVELTHSALEALGLGAPTAPAEERALSSWDMFRSEQPNEEVTFEGEIRTVPLPRSYVRARSAPPLVGRREFGPRGF